MEVKQTFQTKAEALNYVKQLLKDGITYLHYEEEDDQIIIDYKKNGTPFLFDFLQPILDFGFFQMAWGSGFLEITNKETQDTKDYPANFISINYDDIKIMVSDLEDYYLINIKSFPEIVEDFLIVDDSKMKQIFQHLELPYDQDKVMFGFSVLPKIQYTHHIRILTERDTALEGFKTYLKQGLLGLRDFILQQPQLETFCSEREKEKVCFAISKSAISNEKLKDLFVTRF
jgi:hypothetical protein